MRFPVRGGRRGGRHIRVRESLPRKREMDKRQFLGNLLSSPLYAGGAQAFAEFIFNRIAATGEE